MRSIILKRFALIMALIMLCEAFIPSKLLALTSGPVQPEFAGFSNIPTTQMVDLFTGDFNYNIPLFDIPGVGGSYPLNLSYHSVTSAEEESSMVGLGWNINMASISRSVQAVPDDFDSTYISTINRSRKNWTAGATGAISLELFGGDIKKVVENPSLTLNASIFYNNYTGIGMSYSPSASLPLKNSGLSASFGLSLSTIDAPGITGGLDYNSKTKGDRNNSHKFSIGISHNSLSGLKSLNFSTSNSKKYNNVNKKGYNSSYGFGFAPFVIQDDEIEHSGADVSFGIKGELAFYGADAYGSTSGFYSEQGIKKSSKNRKMISFGALYLQNGQNSNKSLLDYTKFNEAPIRKNQLALPSAKIACDIFNVQSPKGAGTYTINRGDVGVIRDRIAKSRIAGATVSFEVGGGAIFKTGGDIEGSVTSSTNDIEVLDKLAFKNLSYKFQGKDTTNFEPAYFRKSYELTGETNESSYPFSQSYDYIRKDSAVRFRTILDIVPGKKNGSQRILTDSLITDNTIKSNIGIGYGKRLNRKPRAEVLNYLTNGQLNKKGLSLSKFNVRVDSITGDNLNPILYQNQKPVKRNFGNSKISAMYQIMEDGEEWVYGLPVVNYIQKEATFSINQLGNNICNPITTTSIDANGSCNSRTVTGLQSTDIKGHEDFLSIRTIPEYASSFLISSILGHDYVDRNNNGPDNQDYGNWIKFEYVQTNSRENPFKWRSPYVGANVNAGFRNLGEDNKANFVYGEKDQYYPYTILTPTYRARFYYSKRDDGKGAGCWLQNTAETGGASSYKLDSVQLVSLELGTVEKTVQFNYDYSLCPGIKNSYAQNPAKLTLRSLSYVNYNNKRGKLTPYVFHYFSDANPSYYSYDEGNADRWGVYRKNTADYCRFSEYPYVNQVDSNIVQNSRAQIEDTLANEIKAWHLSSIDLPSGAQINIDVGRDHYAYLQDNKATQMCSIAGFKDPERNTTPDTLLPANLQKNNLVYFRLEKPIPGDADSLNKLSRYFDDLYEDDQGKQIYFKIFSDLTNKNEFEYVSGYAYIDKSSPFGFGSLKNGYYYYAWVKLAAFSETIKGYNVHPFYFFAWQHLKSNLRKLLYRFDPTEANSKKAKIGIVKQLVDRLEEIVNITRGFYDRCIGSPAIPIQSRGQVIKSSKSFLRLNNSDGFKYGDGIRVNKVSIKTNWCDQATPQYGFVYDYTKKDKIKNKDGSLVDAIISSGVAMNEPYTGSEENAYKYVKGYKEQVIFSVDDYSFQEYPVNISGLPGPGVGYSSVTVRSLASDFMLKKATNTLPGNGLYDIPFSMNQISSKGQEVHEFYTAKDFPTVFEETSLDQSISWPRFGLIPLIGSLKYNSLVGSQGYVTEQNNMHGKEKKISYYGQSKDGLINSEPVSYSEYIYKSKVDIYQRGIVKKYRKRLVNDVVLFNHYKNSSRTAASLVNGELGVNRSFNTMIKSSKSFSGRAGVDINLDGFALVIFPAFVPTVWPSFNISIDAAHTGVTNKMVERAGIIDSVRVFDGNSLITTKNLVFDPIGGAVVLSTVQNQFNNLVYNYNIPAKDPYPLMGGAYENIGYQFNVATDSLCSYSCDSNYISLKLPNYAKSYIVPGDEFIITMPNDTTDIASCVFNDMQNARFVFDTTTKFQKFANLTNRMMKFYLYRSGKRNQLNASASSVVSLCNPTINYSPITYGGNLGFATTFSQSDCIVDAKVTTYSEFWDQLNHEQTRCNNGGTTSCSYNMIKMFNPYNRGVRGIWQPSDQYAYISNRSNDTTNLKYEKLGVYPSFNYYQFDQPVYRFTTTGSNWINTESYRRINENSQVLEQNNALFIPQCTLTGDYGLGADGDIGPYEPSTRVTATIKGSEYLESAFASFETYEGRIAGNVLAANKIARVENFCHFDYFALQNAKTTNIYNVLYRNDVSTYVIDKPFNFSKAGSLAEIFCTDYINSSSRIATISSDIMIVPNLRAYNGKNFSQLSLDSCSCTKPGYPFCRIAISDTFNINPAQYSKSTAIKHTGTQSLVFSNPNTTFNLQQKTLQLIKDKKYFFSCWVYIASAIPDIGAAGVHVDITANNYTSVLMYPNGNRINGWQKVEGYFNGPGTKNFNVIFNKPTSINDLYIDDLRIAPAESQMTSYVYDQILNKLSYILDDNNYYTRYVYNKEGILIGIMKETEKGIKTIQESRNYIPDSPKIMCAN